MTYNTREMGLFLYPLHPSCVHLCEAAQWGAEPQLRQGANKRSETYREKFQNK